MTFEEWYINTVGVSLETAKAIGVADLDLLKQCWAAATATERLRSLARVEQAFRDGYWVARDNEASDVDAEWAKTSEPRRLPIWQPTWTPLGRRETKEKGSICTQPKNFWKKKTTDL